MRKIQPYLLIVLGALLTAFGQLNTTQIGITIVVALGAMAFAYGNTKRPGFGKETGVVMLFLLAMGVFFTLVPVGIASLHFGLASLMGFLGVASSYAHPERHLLALGSAPAAVKPAQLEY